MVIQTPQEFVALQKLTIVRIKAYIDLANDYYDMRVPYPQVSFNLTGMTAGMAMSGSHIKSIRLNPTMLRENPDHFLKVTTGHEVAHLIARTKWDDIEPHGNEWASVMHVFKLPPTRCHNYDVTHVPTVFGRLKNPNRKFPDAQNIKRIGCGKLIQLD